MQQESSSPVPQQQTGNRGSWIPWIFVAGFGIVLAVNATMVYIAASTWTGIAVNRSYDKGLHYNRNLEAANRMAALGWETTIETELTAERAGTVRVTVTDDAGDPLDRADVMVQFERPTHEGYDFVVPMEPVGDGLYSAAFAAPLDGLWDMRLIVTRGDGLFVTTERVMLR